MAQVEKKRFNLFYDSICFREINDYNCFSSKDGYEKKVDIEK